MRNKRGFLRQTGLYAQFRLRWFSWGSHGGQPITRAVKEYAAKGFIVWRARTALGRRPYGRIWMFKRIGGTVVKVTVKPQGYVKEGWA
ncbi:hypothetical protein [Azospirillum palustre]|uniref:hypothetical protein n=1 Tax=Azospirillum palustre TaxID=2044885 RepID=UPI001177A93E|nr:hypothetical protein [Azospirillum palustre]